MKKSIIKITLALLIVFSLSSCFTTSQVNNYAKTTGEVIPIEDLYCSKTIPEDIDVFYEGADINFEYKKIGFVTAIAELNVPDSLVINRLKFNSYQLCGNGVIEVIKSNFTQNNQTYKQYSATSVRIEKDSIYYSQYPVQNDFSYHKFANNDLTYSYETTEFNPGLTFLSVAAVITGIVIKVVSTDEDDDDWDEDDVWEEDDDGWE